MNWMLLAADAVLALHVLFVVFVVLGQVLVLTGGALGWRFVHNFRFRILHLAAIGIVVAQAWLGVLCPLTILEMELRERAGGEVYHGTFIGHWMDRLLYIDAPMWVFVVVYSLFFALVAGSWFWIRPRRGRGGDGEML